MDIGANRQSCSHDLWPPLGLPHSSISLIHSPCTPSLYPPLQGPALNPFLPSQEMSMSPSQAPWRSHGIICPQFPVPLTKTPFCTHSITCLTCSHFHGESIPPFNQLPICCPDSISLSLRSLPLYLLAVQIFFRLTLTDHFHSLPQTLSYKPHILFHINSRITL